MNRNWLLSGRSYRNGGFLLLMLIVTLAIGLLVFGASMLTMDPFAAFNGSGADRYVDVNATPWQEGHLFIDEQLDAYHMGGRREPFPVQPKFEGTTYYNASLSEDGQYRGDIMVLIDQHGDVRAAWDGKFTINDIEYEVLVEHSATDVTSRFSGNIAPLKVYEDDNGRDYKKLYFISCGYALAAGKNGKRIEGSGYVAGWVNKDHTCFGKLWISFPGAETQGIYEWDAVGPTEK